MAALWSLRNMISKLNIQVINISLSSKRPRAIAATRYRALGDRQLITKIIDK